MDPDTAAAITEVGGGASRDSHFRGNRDAVEDSRGLRSDAARHRARILRAARSAFLQDGFDVTTGVIARRAGVGVATVYRRFPDRTALLDELLRDRAGWLAHELRTAVADPDPRTGLTSALRTVVGMRVAARCLPGLRKAMPEVAGENDRLVEVALDPLLQAAHRSGTVRRDVSMRDIRLLFTTVDAYTGSGADEWQRHADAQRVVTHFVRSFTAVSHP